MNYILFPVSLPLKRVGSDSSRVWKNRYKSRTYGRFTPEIGFSAREGAPEAV